ncbi:MAG: hypothetical protein QM766_04805 [Burkholderiaceae bacterium]
MQGIRSKVSHGARAVRRAGVLLAVAALLAGCAGIGNPLGGSGGATGSGSSGTGSCGTGSGAGAQGADDTALPALATDGATAPTAVVESRYSVDGAIMPVIRGQTRTATRADMRRSDAQTRFDNWLMRTVAGDGRRTGITRIDRKLVWELEPAKRLYSECPITGCATSSQPGGQDGNGDKSGEKKPSEPTCPVSIKRNELKVTTSGERRTIHGFATESYGVVWTIALEDGQGRRNTNDIRLDLWTTPETGQVREVQQIDEAFQRRYLAAVGGGDNPVGRYVPRNIVDAMSRFIKGMDANDAKTMQAMAAEMRKIRGYPIRTTMSWTTEGSVCRDAASPGAGGLGGMLGALSGSKPAAGGAAPMITFQREVGTLAVMPVSDSAFVPPSDYQRK